MSRSLPAVVPIVDAGLGNSAYLVDLGNGRALVVDPPRDPRRIRAAADRAGTTIAYVAETHLHADFVSGARQLGAAGAQVLGAAADGRQFGHRALVDGDEMDLGGLRLRAMATPGHTPGHLAYLLLDGDDPLGVFTGGSLLVGSAARTDLVDPDRAAEFARAQYASLRRLLDTLPDHTVVWPTHGAGSFCSAAPAGDRTSTIGRERASNPLVGAPSEEAFVEALLAASGSYPAYFRRLAEVNRRGPALMSKQPDLPALPPDEVAALLGAGAILVDVRPAAAFAAEHVPGAVCIPMRASFASWLGWLVEPDRPIVLVREPEQDVVDVTWRALEVGYERLAGELAGGMPAWVAAGRPTARIPRVNPGALGDARVVDVRQDQEYAEGHLPGALHVELGGLGARLGDLPASPLAVMCAHGERAMTAASLLSRAGRRDVVAVTGGPADWARATGRPLRGGG